ncbi:MAG: ATP-dependent helicase, partial [Anaerolineaceae bacterium]|nr:ATP-dependent helicase [Anaerolineaceae bacterium]
MSESVRLRPSQEEIMKYRSGFMGISAVPGSGKTWTLSLLAANIILSGALRPDQEVLIVTFSNSAVDNFSRRISERLKEAGLLPGIGYTVRTLHGLAHDIIRERPDLAGLSNDFKILDDRDTNQVKSRITNAYISSHPEFLKAFGKENSTDKESAYISDRHLPAYLENLSNTCIRASKDKQLLPEDLKQYLEKYPTKLPLMEFGIELYTDYQRALNYQGGVDFDDLIRLALQCLKYDALLVSNLNDRWPFILEDEAQDSSQLQEHILSIMTGKNGNWVRVGDPNQAIYETFTTADPRLLKEFVNRSEVVSVDLPESGRSTLSIISLANYLIDWIKGQHPLDTARDALSLPHILPAPQEDPQPNPADQPEWINLLETKFTPDEEVAYIAESAKEWLTLHPDHTICVLAPNNNHCFNIVKALKNAGLEVIDNLLRSAESTRLSAGAIAIILRSLSDPQSPSKLAKAFEVWQRSARENEQIKGFLTKATNLIKKCDNVEDYLWPVSNVGWLDTLTSDSVAPETLSFLDSFQRVAQRWQMAVVLPIDQLILTIAQDLFIEPGELAMAHKLALTLRQLMNNHPDWQLPELGQELIVIAKNERRFIGFSDDESGFNPQNYTGKVVVATIHKSKGLEWDKVFLSSVNNYDFPSGMEYDTYYSERWFIKDNLNLEAEALAQLEALTSDSSQMEYTEGFASLKARQDLIRERLRLLYVGITRAKQSLTMTWNSGKLGTSTEAIP